jgi:hypothetical protein
MAVQSRKIVPWKGKDDKVIFNWDDTQRILGKVKSWEVELVADVVEDDWHDQDRTDSTVVPKYYTMRIEVSQEELELVSISLSEIENIDQNGIRKEGWLGIRIKSNGGTTKRLAASGLTLMPMKFASPGRTQNNTCTLELRMQYLNAA